MADIEEEEDIGVDMNSDKYKITLKFVNKLLENIGYKKINDLTEFKNINRDDIIKNKNKKSLDAMEKEFLKYFDKSDIGWYRKASVDYYILTFLRSVCRCIGLKFNFDKKDISEEIDGKKYRRTHIYYTIIER